MPIGKAYGPHNDYTDFLRHFAFSFQSQSSTNPHRLHLIHKVATLILNGQVPSSITPLLTNCRFLALHKDPNNLAKLRPLGIGTAWRRLCSTIVTQQFRDIFASLLLPGGQFGMSIRGGLDYLYHMALTLFDDGIQQPISNQLPPSRVGLIIDFINCWNNASRDACLEQLHDHEELRPLIPYFTLMYGQPTHCYYRCPDGSLNFFLQEEGFPQGDPLSPAFACLVLAVLFNSLNTSLASRAQARSRDHHFGDDGRG